MATAIRDAALEYVKLGWGVMPLEGGLDKDASKRPLAMMDWKPLEENPASAEQVAEWFEQSETANIALILSTVKHEDGKQLVIVDTDSEDEEAWVQGQEAQPLTARVQTGRGWHRYYWAPADLVHFDNVAGLPAVRLGSHYSALPPSVHYTGQRYEWYWGPHPGLTFDELGDFADLPEWGVELTKLKVEKPKGDDDSPLVEGERNNALASVAGGWRRMGFPQETLTTALLEYNEKHCQPPLDKREVEGIAKSVGRYKPEVTPKKAAQAESDAQANEASLLESAPGGNGRKHLTDVDKRSLLVDEFAAEFIVGVEEEKQRPWAIRGLRFGIAEFDKHFGGLGDEGLILVKGGTGKGKTTFCGQAVFQTCVDVVEGRTGPGTVLVYLLEGRKEHFMRRFLAWYGEFPEKLLRAGGAAHTSAAQGDALGRAYSMLPQLPLRVAEEIVTHEGIVADIRSAAAEGPILGVLIDYIQEVQGGPKESNDALRREAIAREWSTLSDEIKAPIMAASQVTKREDGRQVEAWAQGVRNPATLSLLLERGEPGMPEEEKQLSDVMRVLCDKSRNEGAFPPIVCKCVFPWRRVYGIPEWEERLRNERLAREYEEGRVSDARNR